MTRSLELHQIGNFFLGHLYLRSAVSDLTICRSAQPLFRSFTFSVFRFSFSIFSCAPLTYRYLHHTPINSGQPLSHSATVHVEHLPVNHCRIPIPESRICSSIRTLPITSSFAPFSSPSPSPSPSPSTDLFSWHRSD